MSDESHDLDALLRHNADQQMKHFDWDRLSARISSGLSQGKSSMKREAVGPQSYLILRTSHFKLRSFRRPAWAAAVLVVVVLLATVGSWLARDAGPSILEQIAAGTLDAGPLGPATRGTDGLIASADPRNILLAQQVHVLCSDPLLRPHSVWDQEPVSGPAGSHRKEKL